MAANTGATLDTLAGVIQSIAHDKKLLQWFGALAGKPAVERRNEIFSATRQMTEKREDEKVINSLLLLADAKSSMPRDKP